MKVNAQQIYIIRVLGNLCMCVYERLVPFNDEFTGKMGGNRSAFIRQSYDANTATFVHYGCLSCCC